MVPEQADERTDGPAVGDQVDAEDQGVALGDGHESCTGAQQGGLASTVGSLQQHDLASGHVEIEFTDVRVPVANLLRDSGSGFEIAQARLGPGRIHHCMRLIGMAERALERMCKRTSARVAFGKPVSEQGVTVERIAECRIAIEQARLLTLHAAHRMDTVGNKVAKAEIAMIKVAVPAMACKVVDWAIQAHGGGGTSNDFGLAHAYAMARVLRLADGPDEVHRQQLGRMELKKYR